MKKLSPAQERVLRQVADGRAKLVYVGDKAHSLRVWNAIDKDGRKINPTYDVLVKAGLIVAPLASGDMRWVERTVFLSIIGEDALAALPLPGTLVYQEFQRGTGAMWMIRKEEGVRLAFVLYKDGQVYDRYTRAESVYTVFRSFCPYAYNFEGDMSR